MAFESIVHHFFRWRRETPDAPAVGIRADGLWLTRSWRQYVDEVEQAAAGFIALGLKRGERVAVLGFNRVEWTAADMACMAAGGVTVGLYTSCTASQASAVLSHADVRVVVVENDDQYAKVRGAELPNLRGVVMMDMHAESVGSPGVETWVELLDRGRTAGVSEVTARMNAMQAPDRATIVYTSGTTGEPKGVVLTHGNLVAASDFGLQMTPRRAQGMSLVSYLPLAHVAERGLSLLGPSMAGYCVYFAESIEALPENLREVRPTFFLGVPRVWEKIQARLEERFDGVTGRRGALLRWALSSRKRYTVRYATGGKPSLAQRAQALLADRLVLRRIRAALGLDRLRGAISGAAPLSINTLSFFAGLGIVIQEVYGLSETGGPASFNRRTAVRFGSIGRPFDGVDMRLGDDGEILVRGPHIFAGYHNDDAATVAAVDADGWLHTGDLGTVDEEGYYFITGRKKELIITAGGKNIAPQPLERKINEHPWIAESVVLGDRRKYLVALVTLSDQAPPFDGGAGDAAVFSTLQSHIDWVNEGFARVETIKRFAILPRAFAASLGELTPTQKLVRHVIHEHFKDEIASLYDSAGPTTKTVR